MILNLAAFTTLVPLREVQSHACIHFSIRSFLVFS
jgi:hypothetical protein